MPEYRAILAEEPGDISHYGILGMKWGHRKDGKPQGYQSTAHGSAKAQAKLIYMDSRKRQEQTIAKAKKAEEEAIKNHKSNDDIDDYTKVYKEMGVDMNSEDTSVYKQAEYEYRKKHGLKSMEEAHSSFYPPKKSSEPKRDPSKGVGLTKKEQKLFDKSIRVHEEHRKKADAVAKKVKDHTYQRSDLKQLTKASVKDLKAIEKYAKATGQMSKDGKAYIRARAAKNVIVPAHHTIAMAGGVAGTGALVLQQPLAAMGIGAGTSLATLGTSALNHKVSSIAQNTGAQYHNDLIRANKKRKPIEAYG